MTTQSNGSDRGRIDVERLGGLARYGMEGSHLRSRGFILFKDLSPADQRILLAIFLLPSTPPEWVRDVFLYRLTRQTNTGPQTVTVAENLVPEAIRDSVHDEITPM